MRQSTEAMGFRRTHFRELQRPFGIVTALLLLAGASCADWFEPVAAIKVDFARGTATQGAVIAAALSVTVLPAFEPQDQDYRVFVHFLDADGNLLWTDDHDPPLPSSGWRPGQTLAYERRVPIPPDTNVGRATVAVGLYSAPLGERLPLAGHDLGQRAYRAATLTIAAAARRNTLTYERGWYDAESAAVGGRGTARWRWTSESAGLSFPNPYSDAVLQLLLDGRPDLVLGGRQELEVALDGRTIRRVVLDSLERQFVEVLLAGRQLGSGRTVRVDLHVRQTFVPSEVPGSDSIDDRRLGVRVHHAFVDVR